VLLVALIPITIYARGSASRSRRRPRHRGRGSRRWWCCASRFVVIALRAARAGVHHRRTLIFAVTVRPLGLVIASFVSLVVSANATEESAGSRRSIWAAVLTAFCSLLFPYGLNLPLQLWPRF
jgi:hypothetical protein